MAERTGDLKKGGIKAVAEALIAEGKKRRAAAEANGEPMPEPEPEREVCATCGGARFVGRRRPISADDFGVAVPCPACNVDSRSIEERMRAMGFERMATFGTWRRSAPLEAAVAACKELVELKRWVVFLRGGVGTGKTHLATATAHLRVLAGATAAFWNVPDLLDAIRSCYDRGAEQAQYDFLKSRLYNRDLLVLDDLGANKPTVWSHSMLYEIVDTFYRARETKQLIATTNIGDDSNYDRQLDMQRIEGRLLSRLSPGVIEITGAKDRRREFDR